MQIIRQIGVFTCLLLFSAFCSCTSSDLITENGIVNADRSKPVFLDNISFNGSRLSKKVNSCIASNDCDKNCTENTALNAIQEKYACFLNVIPQTIGNASLYHFIDEWYGVPYRLGGGDKSGIDCSALVQRIYEQVFGLSVLRTAFEQFNKSNLLWDAHEMKEGDLVFFRIHSKRVTHVGIYLINNFFLHASNHGVMISSLNESYWKKYFAGAGRML